MQKRGGILREKEEKWTNDGSFNFSEVGLVQRLVSAAAGWHPLEDLVWGQPTEACILRGIGSSGTGAA